MFSWLGDEKIASRLLEKGCERDDGTNGTARKTHEKPFSCCCKNEDFFFSSLFVFEPALRAAHAEWKQFFLNETFIFMLSVGIGRGTFFSCRKTFFSWFLLG